MADLRVYQAYVNVAGSKTGSAKVSRLYVETLSPLPDLLQVSATSGIAFAVACALPDMPEEALLTATFTTIATGSVLRTASASNSISFDQNAIWEGFIPTSAESALAVSGTAVCSLIASRGGCNSLDLTHSLEYIGPIDVSAATEIHFDQSTRFPEEFLRSTDHAIFFHASAEHSGGTRRVQTSSVFAFTSTADNPEKNRSVTTETGFFSEARAYNIKQLESSIHFEVIARPNVNALFAPTSIEFAQHARYAPVPVEASSIIDFNQNTWTNIQCHFVETVIDFSVSETSERPFIAPAESAIDLQGYADILLIYGRSIHQYISWSQQGKKAHDVTASSEMVFGQESGPCKGDTAPNAITFDQDAYGGAGKPVCNSISFTGTATCLFSKALKATGSLSLESVASYYRRVNTPTKTPQPGILPDASRTTCYLSDGETTIEFKSPNFGNRERLSFNRIQRESRGGTLRVYADPKWPKAQTFVAQFSYLTRAKANSIQDFIEATLGKKVTFCDWEGQTWEGIITTPDNPTSEDKRNRCSLDFEFEVEL